MRMNETLMAERLRARGCDEVLRHAAGSEVNTRPLHYVQPVII